MNVVNMERLAKAVEKNDRLMMSNIYTGTTIRTNTPSEVTLEDGRFCGRACCIAGEGGLLFDRKSKNTAWDITVKACGLTRSQAEWLFCGEWDLRTGIFSRDNMKATRAIRKLIAEPDYRGEIE